MTHIINLFCGIGLFLTGITLMSESVSDVFGEKLKAILGKVTNSKAKAVATSALVTGAIQSSCATTVMTVSFVDKSLMSLSDAVGLIMGANIGTTVTSLLIAFNFSSFAPLFVFLGTVIRMFCKKENIKGLADVLIGFGLLFLGLNTMSVSFDFLKETEFFTLLLSHTKGRLGAITAGFLITAIMQSSSATVGILQSLAFKGLVTTSSSFYIILGQNIGAVIPVILSSIGKSKNAKRTALIHLLFNSIGTVIFIVIMSVFPLHKLFSFTENNSMRISLFHILFNTGSTVILLPFSEKLVELTKKIIR